MKPFIQKSIIIIGVMLFLLSCEKQNPPPSQNTSSTSTTGTNQTNTSAYTPDSLTGTIWILYQYRDEKNANPLLRSDTLKFISEKNYTWNGIPQKYSLYTTNNIYNKYVLRLENTPFGTLVGFPPLTIKTYGEIIDESFTQSGATNAQTFQMWFKKIN